MSPRRSKTGLRLYLGQTHLLAVGFVWGLLAAHGALQIELDLVSEIQRARSWEFSA